MDDFQSLFYPERMEEFIKSLPTSLDDCISICKQYGNAYKRCVAYDECTADLILDTMSHLQYRFHLLNMDLDEHSQAYVRHYERSLPLMIWNSKTRDEYLVECGVKCEIQPKLPVECVFPASIEDDVMNSICRQYGLQTFEDEDQLQVEEDSNPFSHLFNIIEIEFDFYLPRLFSIDLSENTRPKFVPDIKYVNGSVKRMDSRTVIVDSKPRSVNMYNCSRFLNLGAKTYELKHRVGYSHYTVNALRVHYFSDEHLRPRQNGYIFGIDGENLSLLHYNTGENIYCGSNYAVSHRKAQRRRSSLQLFARRAENRRFAEWIIGR